MAVKIKDWLEKQNKLKRNYNAQWLVIKITLQSIESSHMLPPQTCSRLCLCEEREEGMSDSHLRPSTFDLHSMVHDWRENDLRAKTHQRGRLMAVMSLTHDVFRFYVQTSEMIQSWNQE